MMERLHALPFWPINLPRAVKRGKRMETQFALVGLPYTLFPGLDGRAEAERMLANRDIPAVERNMDRKILVGGIGCYHPHLAVCEAFLLSGMPVGLIVEDNVVFDNDFPEAVRLALHVRERWDLLTLNRIRANLPVNQGRVGHYCPNADVGPATGTGGDLIKRETSARRMPAMRRVTRATDHEINRFFVHDPRLRGVELCPSHVDDGVESPVTGTGFADVQKSRGRARWPYYRLKSANYLRRLACLARRGEIIQRSGSLLTKQDGDA